MNEISALASKGFDLGRETSETLQELTHLPPSGSPLPAGANT
jgi:hypothetical protein